MARRIRQDRAVRAGAGQLCAAAALALAAHQRRVSCRHPVQHRRHDVAAYAAAGRPGTRFAPVGRRGVLGRRGHAEARRRAGWPRLSGNDRLCQSDEIMNTAFQHTNNTDHHAAHTMTNSSTVSTPSIAAPTEAREAKKGSLAAFKGLLPFLRPYLKQFIMAGIALVVASCATLAIPAAFKQMIDLGFGGTGAKSIKHVDLVFLALFGVATVLALATAARFYTVSWLGERVTADIRTAVYQHVVTQIPDSITTTPTDGSPSRSATETLVLTTDWISVVSVVMRNVLL